MSTIITLAALVAVLVAPPALAIGGLLAASALFGARAVAAWSAAQALGIDPSAIEGIA